MESAEYPKCKSCGGMGIITVVMPHNMGFVQCDGCGATSGSANDLAMTWENWRELNAKDEPR